MNFFKGIGTFFGLFTTHWQGTLIGLAVGIVLSLLITGTILKFGGPFKKILMIIICILTMFVGASFQSIFFTHQSYEDLRTPEEVMEDIDKGLQDRYTNTNGFTKEQHEDAQDDLECPEINDILLDLNYKDYGNFVCFYYKNTDDTVVNIVFRKTSAGLYLDGVLNASGEYTENFPAFNLFNPGTIDFNSFEWELDYTEPIYSTKIVKHLYPARAVINGVTYDNHVSVSADDASFVSSKYVYPIGGYKYVTTRALVEGEKLTLDTANDSFTYFNNHQVELVGLRETIFKDLNTLYNFLYSKSNLKLDGSSTIIDATSYLCSPIPEPLRENYPVNSEFKEKHPDIEYYQTYRCNISVRLTKEKADSKIALTNYQKEFIDDTIKDETRKPDVPKDIIKNADVFVNFINTNNANLSNVNLSSYPIKITFNSSSLEQPKTLVIDNLEDLNATNFISFPEYSTMSYEITSTLLYFEEVKGTFNVTTGSSNLKFKYSYDDGYIMYKVALQPIVSIDKTKIDLSEHNVKIILNNSTDQYIFTFDDNAKLDTAISQPIKMGEYTYTILSNQLIFGNVTGTLTVSTTDTSYIFHYALNEDIEELKFEVGVNPGECFGTVSLVCLKNVVESINKYIKVEDEFNINVSIYDATSNMLVETYVHKHSHVDNSCLSIWDSPNLIDGMKYLVQLRLIDRNDSTKTYSSNIHEFTYGSSVGVSFLYTFSSN